MQNARNRLADQPEEEQHRLGLARGGGFKPSARDGLRVRLLGQTDATSPVWRPDAEPRPNGPFMWQSSGPEDVIFSFFVLSVESGTVRLIVKKAECVNKHPETVYLFGTIRSALGQQRRSF
jgi:hypothetical protein